MQRGVAAPSEQVRGPLVLELDQELVGGREIPRQHEGRRRRLGPGCAGDLRGTE